MKKIISVLCLVSIMASSYIPSFAAGNNSASAMIPQTSVGILETDEGTKYAVKGEMVAVATPKSSNDSTKVTYKYDVPVSPKAGGSSTVHGNDGAIASTVYLTVDFLSKSNPTQYLLTGVSGYWTVNVPNVGVSSAYVSYTCSGRFPANTHQSRLNRAVNNNFSLQTGFTKYVVENDAATKIGANLKLNYIMGSTRTWSFTLYNDIAG